MSHKRMWQVYQDSSLGCFKWSSPSAAGKATPHDGAHRRTRTRSSTSPTELAGAEASANDLRCLVHNFSGAVVS